MCFTVQHLNASMKKIPSDRRLPIRSSQIPPFPVSRFVIESHFPALTAWEFDVQNVAGNKRAKRKVEN
jgi:hypothetical protein